MPDVDLTPWRELLDFDPADSISNHRIQRLEDAHGDLNLDFFSVDISWLPVENGRALSPEQFLDQFRLNMNMYTDGLANFEPLFQEDQDQWRSDKPLGTAVHIDLGTGLKNIDDGSVVLTRIGPTSFTFTTIDVPGFDWEHPVSGHREFGIIPIPRGQLTTYRFYTRGVDRPTGRLEALWPIQNIVFAKADELWHTVMDKITQYINEHSGNATRGPVTTERVDWDRLREDTRQEGHREIETHSARLQELQRMARHANEERERMRLEHERMHREFREQDRRMRDLQRNLALMGEQQRQLQRQAAEATQQHLRDNFQREQSRLLHDQQRAQMERDRMSRESQAMADRMREQQNRIREDGERQRQRESQQRELQNFLNSAQQKMQNPSRPWVPPPPVIHPPR